MARQVYFDPFGMRTQGFRTGMQDEIALQDQTRRARASDWDYNNLAPLRLNEAQRADTLGEFALPYQQNAYGINQRQSLSNLFGSEQGNYERIGQATGDYAPALTNSQLYGSGQYQGSEELFPAMTRYVSDALTQNPVGDQPNYMQELASMFGIDPNAFQQALQQLTGTISPNSEVGYDQFLGYDRMRQNTMDQRQMQNDLWNRQIQQQAAQAAQQNADQLGGYYQMIGGARAGAADGSTGYTGAEDGF